MPKFLIDVNRPYHFSFFAAMNSVWDEVLELNRDHKLVTVFHDRIEAIE
mgnify:FL=1